MIQKISKIAALTALLFVIISLQNALITAQTSESNDNFNQSPTVGQTIDLSTPEGYLNYLSTVRSNVAIASFSLKANGSVNLREPIIFHNPDKKITLASVVKVIHLAVYAKAVETGRLDPNRLVTVREWEQTYLPGTDGFAHGASLRELGIPIDEFGFALNPDTTVTVAQMVKSMMRFSDNAAPDWLLSNLGSEIFAEVVREAGLTGQDLPPFITGSFLVLENHDKGLMSETTVREIRRWSRRKLEREVARLQNLYLDPAWRQAELEWRFVNQDQLGNRVLSSVVEDILAKGTVGDYASMLIRILNGTFLSAQISATMRANLETALSFSPTLYRVYGAKGGSLDTGLLNNVAYSIANSGDYADKRRITIVFHRRIALDIFDQIFSEPFVSLQFGDKLATDRAFARRVQSVFPLFGGR